jgi:hypothetical protein
MSVHNMDGSAAFSDTQNGAMKIAKPRVYGIIANLPAEQREQIYQWFRENLTYPEIKKRCQSEFSVKISVAALCEYYSRHSFEIFGGSDAASRGPAPGQVFCAEIVLHIQIRPEVRLTSVRANTIESQ